MSSTVSRRKKLHLHPSPSPMRNPMIVHFQRSRRTHRRNNQKSLIRRERVDEREEGYNISEEKWRSQAEMERELGLKKTINLQTTLRSAVQTLLSARKKIVEGKKNSNAVLEEEIEELQNLEKQVGVLSCSGRCKAMVERVVEQVRAETEQWSQMQRMLEQVRGEMEELHASRHYWKEKALHYELQLKHREFYLMLNRGQDNKDFPPISLAKQLAKEKRSTFIRTTTAPDQDRTTTTRRRPLRDIVNLSQRESSFRK